LKFQVGYWDSSTGLTVNVSVISWLGEADAAPEASRNSMKNKTFQIVTIQVNLTSNSSKLFFLKVQ
jgi:hypothetical protein